MTEQGISPTLVAGGGADGVGAATADSERLVGVGEGGAETGRPSPGGQGRRWSRVINVNSIVGPGSGPPEDQVPLGAMPPMSALMELPLVEGAEQAQQRQEEQAQQ